MEAEKLRTMEVIQNAEEEANSFSKWSLISEINSMTQDEFNNFCREIQALNHHYDSSINTPACDFGDFVEQHPDKFFKHAPIDLSSPGDFRLPESV